MRLSLSFYECEHSGDLDGVMNDLRHCEATIVGSILHYDEDTARVVIEVLDIKKFFELFKRTPAYHFTDYDAQARGTID